MLDVHVPAPDGIEIARTLRGEGVPTECIVFSATIDATLIRKAFDAGVSGFVSKDATLDIVTAGIRAVLAGQRFVDPSVAADLLTEAGNPLSSREQQVLQLMANGLTNGEIGRQLCVADDTVKAHISTILRKLDSSGRTGAVAEAFRRNLVH
jgi:two-component system response regulator DesR